MICPFCKEPEQDMVMEKHDFHHARAIRLSQPMNDILSILYKCPECGVTVETTQQVRITSPKKEE